MFADEMTYRASLNNFGMDALVNTDDMMQNVIGVTAFEYTQNLGITEITANNPAPESIQSELEKIQAMQTSLELVVNSPFREAIRNEDRIIAGITGGLLDISPQIILSLAEMNELASLKSSLGPISSPAVDWINSVAPGSALSSFENGLAKNLLEEVNVNRLTELALIEPYKSEFPDLMPLPSISKEVSLSPETIEMLAEKIAEKGGRIEITATHRSIVIAGDALNSSIDTRDMSSDKES